MKGMFMEVYPLWPWTSFCISPVLCLNITHHFPSAFRGLEIKDHGGILCFLLIATYILLRLWLLHGAEGMMSHQHTMDNDLLGSRAGSPRTEKKV